jgi:hypothetical protein
MTKAIVYFRDFPGLVVAGFAVSIFQVAAKSFTKQFESKTAGTYQV